MKRCLLLFTLAGLLLACKEVSFPEPQPKGIASVAEIPPALRGQYLARESDGSGGDTIVVEPWGYHLRDKNENDWLGQGRLSDSLVVKVHQNYYFVNFRANDQWVLRVIQRLPNGDLNFMMLDVENDEVRKPLLKKLGKFGPVKEVKHDDDTFYQINPSPAQLMQMIKEGYFKKETLERIGN
jgi:hypothetical protein